MRFAILASGSKGNAAIVEHRNSLVLIDCGISYRRLCDRMGELGAQASDVSCMFLTHEHGDHTRGLEMLSRRTGIRTYMTRGTAHSLRLGNGDYHPLRSGEAVGLGDGLVVEPYTIPHDAREAVHFRVSADGSAIGFATDIGSPNDHVAESLCGCNALVLECNYDPDMLEGNLDYPPSLKNRIRGGRGHMSNDQASDLLGRVAHPQLRLVVAAHQSDNNNRPELALKALESGLNGSRFAPSLVSCPQGQATGWLEVAASPS